MSDLTVFQNSNFGEIRTITRDGEPWFVAADVCRALEIKNSRDAIAKLDDDEKGVALTDTLGGKQELTIINEPGLYTLVLGSRKPEAKAFKRWITHEVIPAIRKTGQYSKRKPVDKNLGNVVRMMELTRNAMKEVKADPHNICIALKKIADENGVFLPECFVQDKAATLDELLSMVDYIYAQPRGRGKRVPTYEDWLTHAAEQQTLPGTEAEKLTDGDVTTEIIIRRTRRNPLKK